MQITYAASGGVTGARLRCRLDTATLGAAGRDLVDLVTRAGLLDARASGSGPAVADAARHTIHVADGDHEVTVAYDDASAPPEVRPLLSRLQAFALDPARATRDPLPRPD